jgi:hypothetical protein
MNTPYDTLPPTSSRVMKVLIALDELGNAFGPASQDGMTISAHAGMAAADGKLWGRILSYLLNVLQKDHCKQAMQHDYERAALVMAELKPYLEKLGTLPQEPQV